MGEVRPKLILSDSSRRRRGSGGGSLFMLLLVFAAGVYVGTKLDDVGLWGEKDAGAPVAAVTAAVERFGRIDVVVNNAGRGLLSADFDDA